MWIKNSIPSTDGRSGRDEMCITKMKFMHVHKHTLDFEDENITEFTKIKKDGTSKSYMKSQRMIYTKTIRKMHTDFVASRDNIECSFSAFFRYEPFYITPPSEREKESSLCIKC